MKIKVFILCLFTLALFLLYSAPSHTAKKTAVTVMPLKGDRRELSDRAVIHITERLIELNSIRVESMGDGPGVSVSMGLSEPPIIVREAPSDKGTTGPVLYDNSFEQSFTADDYGLAGVQLNISTYGQNPEKPYHFFLRESRTGIIREASVKIPESAQDSPVTIRFDPVINSRNRKYTFTVSPSGVETDNPLSIILYSTDNTENEELTINNSKTDKRLDFTPLYSRFTVSANGEDSSESIENISDKTDSQYMILCDVSEKEGASLLTARVYSTSLKTVVYDTEEQVNDSEDLKKKSGMIASRISVALSGKLPSITSVEPTMGDSEKAVFISWKPVLYNYRFRVYRANKIRGPYILLGTSDTTSFIDHTAEPGLQYWYRVQPFNESIYGDMSRPAAGYRKILITRGEDLQEILDRKNQNTPPVGDSLYGRTMKKELSFLEEYYTNSITLSVIMLIGRSYMEKGRILVFNDLGRYSLDYKNSLVYIVKENDLLIRFYSKKLFRMRDKTMPLHNTISSITFSAAGNSASFSAAGFTPAQGKSRRNSGPASSMDIPVTPQGTDLYLDMELAPASSGSGYSYEKMSVSANGRSIGTVSVTKKGKYRLTVPSALLKDSSLKLKFAFPGKSTGNGGNISFYSINISKKVLPLELFERLMKNAVYYCIYDGDRPVNQSDGSVRYLPVFQTLGISTEYFRDNRNWKSNTVMITTSDKRLLDEMKKARK